ncbi:MAG: DUF1549 domain-containing protein [Verrucomicrobiaceae bacterium]|nr:DUF1549 domain-containing protein [Verrucomicrobiaceae bacterium]
MDRYILARMEKVGVSPAPAADARTVLRRLSFDLIGLPPTLAEVQAFQRDYERDPQAAVSATVDRLLAAPQYGERWARHWLDLARFTDQTASWLESTRYSHLYRDWVVRAFNDDLPYDQFVMRQLASDVMPECDLQDLHALGFLGLSPTYWKELQLPPDIIKTTVADEWEEHVDAVGRTFLGLTLACARCHDHKSDPITAADYYALAGVFASVKIAERPVAAADIWAPVAKAREAVEVLEKQIADLKKKKPADMDAKLKGMTAKIAGIKSSTPHYDLPMANGVVDAALYVVEADNKKGTKMDYRDGMARDLELQKRGNPNDVGDVVPRRFLSAFPTANGTPRPFTHGSGRLDLAHALVEEGAALTARVMVNRVWKHHFGRGLVDTPSEFGNLGDAPTHPELLDDLTSRFIAQGWSLKWLHREILCSATWRQSSLTSEEGHEGLFATMQRRKLEWEAWRDAMLEATGVIDLRMGGEAASLAEAANHRRSLYGIAHRHEMEPMLRVHDFPDVAGHTPARAETITPLQGLFALNAPFMQQQADAMAQRLSGALDEKVLSAYALLFQRLPRGEEMAMAREFFVGREEDLAAWSQYAQALMATNEFLFID